MHVGMNRHNQKIMPETCRVPHARGDEPDYELINEINDKSSPCTWG